MAIKNTVNLLLFGMLSFLTACTNDLFLLPDDMNQLSKEKDLAVDMERMYFTDRENDYTLMYPLNSFIEIISLDESDRASMDNTLNIMQTDLGNGYNPLFSMLLQKLKIKKISRGLLDGGAQGAYNPGSNTLVLNINTPIILNVISEELIHAGQNRVYKYGIKQYNEKGKPNIEFEAKVTQDLINFLNDWGQAI